MDYRYEAGAFSLKNTLECGQCFRWSIFKSMIKEITVYPEKFSFVLSNGLVLCEMRR